MPSWADEIRRPEADTIEYWRPIGAVTSSDHETTTTVALVQNGPDMPVQILVAGVRYTLGEVTDLTTDLLWAVRIVQEISFGTTPSS